MNNLNRQILSRSSVYCLRFFCFCLGCFIVFWCGYQIGYIFTHEYIAQECKKLGGFFVGQQVFKCVKIERIEK